MKIERFEVVFEQALMTRAEETDTRCCGRVKRGDLNKIRG